MLKFSTISLRISAAVTWLLLVALLAALSLSQGLTLNSSIMSLLPIAEQQPVVQIASEKMSQRFSDRVVILISGQEQEQLQQETSAFAQALAQLSEVSKVDWTASSEALNDSQEMFPYRFAVLDESTRKLLIDDQGEELAAQALRRIFNPLSAGRLNLLEDPFGLFERWQTEQINNLSIDTSSGFFEVKNSPQLTYMLVVTLGGNPFATSVQKAVVPVIEKQRAELAKKNINVAMSGMLLHAAAGTEQAENEMATIGAGSLLGIMLMVFWVFSGARNLFLLLLPVLVGCVVAVALTVQVFGSIHVVTLTFGAGLVGVAVDYSMHFLCERRASTAQQTIKKLWPGLALGLFSSVLAYAAQGLAPFPGLQQMAFFAVIGLVSAWLSVWFLLPMLTWKDELKPIKAAEHFLRFYKACEHLKSKKVPKLVMLLFVMIGSISLWLSQANDDVRLLQTSSSELIAEERSVQTALKSPSSSHYLVIRGDELEAVLQKEEQLRSKLDELRAQGVLSSYRAISTVLPSLARQQADFLLTQSLYRDHLADVFGNLNLPSETINAVNQQISKGPYFLTLAAWRELAVAQSWEPLLLEQSGQFIGTVLMLGSSLPQEAQQSLMTLSDTHVDVLYIDRIAGITDLLTTYRSEISYWLSLAYLAVFAVLAIRYKTSVLRIIAPPLVASLLALALVSQIEGGINLFNLMALILVLGIGLDMGIFLQETDGSVHTWVAVTLSTCTSVLAFGLLTFSQTPVLHHFGLTVLVGLLLVWLITLMTQPLRHDLSSKQFGTAETAVETLSIQELTDRESRS